MKLDEDTVGHILAIIVTVAAVILILHILW